MILIMRAFVEKSRTCFGWRGFVNQSDLSQPEDILTGIQRTQDLFKKLTTPLAMECIDPMIYPHLEEFLSWGCIGARTSTSSTHRILASNACIPFGFKNSLDGNVLSAIHGSLVAQQSHCILTSQGQIFSQGNKDTHIILRGGDKGVNYTKNEVEKISQHAKSLGLFSPLLIDCSHGNAPCKPDDQKVAFNCSLERALQSPEKVFGIMLESHIYKGSNKKDKLFGLSLTDPCLSFEQTRELLLYGADKITQQSKGGLNLPTSYVCSH